MYKGKKLYVNSGHNLRQGGQAWTNKELMNEFLNIKRIKNICIKCNDRKNDEYNRLVHIGTETEDSST